MTVKAIHYQLQ